MMEATVPSRSLKVTIKLKRDKKVDNSSTTADHLNYGEGGEHNASNSSNLPGNPTTFSEDLVNLTSEEVIGDHGTEDEGNQISENSQLQLVLYDPAVNGAGNSENAPDPVFYASPLRKHPFADQTPRVLPAIGAFTVQCANCFKWRLIPTKEKYEEIREHIVEQPFLCETAREWRSDISCDDPPDLTQDGSRLWAIDKPNIAQPPPGWQRLLRIRGEGSTKFADVYYVAPSGKRLRSMVEIQKYLEKHPEYMQEGVSLSKFSFQIPRPLQENYVRKRPSRPVVPNDVGDLGNSAGYPPPSEVPSLSWIDSDVGTDLHLSSPGFPNNHFEAPRPNPEIRLAKKMRTQSEWTFNDRSYNQNDVNVEEPNVL